MIGLKKLGGNALLYAAGVVIQRAASFLLIPLYTSYLLVTGYGKIETIDVIVQALMITINFGLSNAVLRFYSSCTSSEQVGVMLRTSFVLVFGLASAVILPFLPLLKGISQVILHEGSSVLLLVLAIIWAIGGALNQQVFAYYRARQAALSYVGLSLGIFVFSISLNILFLRFLNLGVLGAVLGSLLVVWSINAWYGARWWTKGRLISVEWGKKMLKFGSPLVFAGIGWFLINSSDRYFLSYYHGLEEVGIYSLGYKVGLIAQMLVTTPLQLSWAPYVFSRHAEIQDGSKREFGRVLTYLALGFGAVGLGLYFFSPLLVRFLGSGRIGGATQVVPYVILAYVFSGLHYYSSVFFHLLRRTGLLSTIIFSSAGLNIVLNFLLIPPLGWQGAAVATLITIVLVGCVTYLVGQRIFAFPVETDRLGKILIAVLAALISYQLMPEINIWVDSLYSLVCLAVFLGVLLLTGFFSQEELRILGKSMLTLQKQIALKLKRAEHG